MVSWANAYGTSFLAYPLALELITLTLRCHRSSLPKSVLIRVIRG